MKSYIDKKLGLERVYTLEDRVIVIEISRWFVGSSRLEFALEKLKTTPDEHWIKDDKRTALAGVPGFVAFLIVATCGGVISEKTVLGFYVLLAVSILAMLIGFVFGGRVRARTFKNQEETALFDIVDRGRSGEFESFTTELMGRIARARERTK